MNFDELQKQWNNQPVDEINIKKESLHKTKSIIEKVNKNFITEFYVFLFLAIFLAIVPYIKLYKINGLSAIFYYFILFQMILCAITYYKKFFSFRKSSREIDSFKSKQSVLKMYYELKFAVDTYRSSCYFLIPQSILLYLILLSFGKGEIYFQKILHFQETFNEQPFFIIGVLLLIVFFILLVVGVSEWVINYYFGKYLKQLKQLLDEFED